MKKIIFIFVIILIFNSKTYCQKDSIKEKEIVSGFDGDKPLLQDENIGILFEGDNIYDVYFFPAYKGETKKMFLQRLNFEGSYIPAKDSLKLSKDSISSNTIMSDNNGLPPWGIKSKIIFYFILFLLFFGIFWVYKSGPRK